MSFIVLHADRAHTLVADDALVPARDVATMQDAAALLVEARRLRERFADDVERARIGAVEQGLAQGREQARAEAETAMTEALARIEAAAAERAGAQRHGVARLAIEVVRRIAGELPSGELVAALAERTAATLSHERGVTVRVAPSLGEAVRLRLASRPELTVEPDPALADTDCVLETPLGRTRAGLDTQLAAIERAWGLS